MDRPARLLLPVITAAIMTSLAACGEAAKFSVAEGSGPSPRLPDPTSTLLPTTHIATAVGWPANGAPVAAAGMTVNAFARDLDHPRWLYVLPNGDVLVAESNAPPKPDDAKGIKGFIQKLVMKRAGAQTPSANRITLLRDTDGDGIAETRFVFAEHVNSPFGMVLVGNDLYVAASDAVLRFDYTPGMTQVTGTGSRVVELPAGTINHHWTKNITASADGAKLYVTVGSNSNVAENGIAAEEGRASIWEIDRETGAHRIYASGLRNPNGMAWTKDGVLWTVVNERDELGSDLVPDYLTSVKDGAFYGWPYSYYGQHVDVRVKERRPDLVAKATVPDYALGNHTASLGLAIAPDDARLPGAFASGMFVGQHGSWNRQPFSGYKVVFVPFANNRPAGLPIDVLTGFLSPQEEAWGRPVGVAFDKPGDLLVADDVGNVVWRVAAKRS